MSTTSNVAGPSRTVSATPDAHGNVTSLTYPDGKTFNYEYDRLDRVTKVRDPQGTVIFDRSYGDRGLPSTENLLGATRTITPDSMSRVGSLSHNFSGSSFDFDYTFTFNRVGQIRDKQISNTLFLPDHSDDSLGTYQVNGLNQYTSAGGYTASYDARGNLTSHRGVGYQYDLDNRLVRVTGGKSATLDYDPSGRLVKIGSTEFVYFGSSLLAEYSSGSMSDRYVHLPGMDQPIAYYSGSSVSTSSIQTVHRDERGSVVALANASGQVVAYNRYDAFGETTNPLSGRFGFTGQVYLPEIDLYYYKARVYDPKIGRFLQTDPIGYQDGMNWYAYVGNDPVNAVDPTGLYIESAIEIASIGVGIASLSDNLSQGNWGWAAVDALGIVIDGAALAVPGVPGGVGLGVKTLREGSEAAGRAVSNNGLKRAEAARDAELAEISKLSKTQQSKITTVVGAYDPATGNIAVGVKKTCAANAGKCAEDLASEALGNPENIEFTMVVRPRNENVIPRCDRCTSKYGPEN